MTIVVEGGPDTLSTICKDLRQDIPVVLIDGSGRAPNLLAKFLNRTESLIVRIEKNTDSNDFKKLLDTNDPDDLQKFVVLKSKSKRENIDVSFFQIRKSF